MAALAVLIGTAQGHVWTGVSLEIFVAMYRVRVTLLLRQVPRAADLTTVGNLAAAATFIVAALTHSLALLALAGLSAFKAWADRDYFAGQEVWGALKPGPMTGDR